MSFHRSMMTRRCSPQRPTRRRCGRIEHDDDNSEADERDAKRHEDLSQQHGATCPRAIQRRRRSLAVGCDLRERENARVLRTRLTRAIQRRHGYKPVPVTCRDCGLSNPSLEDFPSGGIMGAAALAWVASGRRPMFGSAIRCPRCGRAITWAEEMQRRRREEH